MLAQINAKAERYAKYWAQIPAEDRKMIEDTVLTSGQVQWLLVAADAKAHLALWMEIQDRNFSMSSLSVKSVLADLLQGITDNELWACIISEYDIKALREHGIKTSSFPFKGSKMAAFLVDGEIFYYEEP